MTKRKPKPEPAPKLVMGECGHLVDKERFDDGWVWCMESECVAKYADIHIRRTDPETGAVTYEEAGPQERAWFREEGP